MADMAVKAAAVAQTPEQLKRQQDKEAKLQKVCADFESIFTYNLLKTMRKTIPSGGVLPRSAGQDTWEMMMDQQVAKGVSEKGQGLGLKATMYNQLKKNLKI